MKSLRWVLILTYVIIIILLLISMAKCSGCKPIRQTDDVPADSREVTDTDTSTATTIMPVVKESFKADVVMCIDCTGSMDDIINTIKSNALKFYPDVKRVCLSKGKEIKSMRIKVIGFRDYGESNSAFEQSEFFDFPDDEQQFKTFVSSLVAIGGGDDAERGYDALGLAMSSDWNNDADCHQVIILWTDSASHLPCSISPGPKSKPVLKKMWDEKMRRKAKRMILFAPNVESWTSLENEWDNVVRHDVNRGGGLSDVDYDEIINALSESM